MSERQKQQFEQIYGGDRLTTSGAAIKAANSYTKMYKTMYQTANVMDPILAVFDAFNPFSVVMQALQPVFDVISGLMSVMGAQILPVLIDAIRPLLNILMEMKPIFEVIGKIIAILLEVALIPLQIFFEILYQILEPLMPFIQMFSDFLDTIITGIRTFFDILFGWIQVLLDSVTDIAGMTSQGINWAFEQIGLPSLPGFDDGGRMIMDGIAQMKAGEIAVTGDQLGGVEDKLDALLMVTTQAQQDAYINMKFGGSGIK